MSEVADILRQAADLIEPEGAWTQDEYWKSPDCKYSDLEPGDEIPPWGPDADCFCVIGAIGHVLQSNPDDTVVDPFVASVAATVGVPGGNGLAKWNDAPGRTQAEVVAALRAAADKAEGAKA